jgi:hypothetical protein
MNAPSGSPFLYDRGSNHPMAMWTSAIGIDENFREMIREFERRVNATPEERRAENSRRTD